MKFLFTKEVEQRMGRYKLEHHVGAGKVALKMYRDLGLLEKPNEKDSLKNAPGAFAKFVHLKRREMGLSLNQLADKADIDTVELHEIENNTNHKSRPRTISNLAKVFVLPLSAMKELSGMVQPKNDEFVSETIRFAACSDNITDISGQDRELLFAFISYLSNQKGE